MTPERRGSDSGSRFDVPRVGRRQGGDSSSRVGARLAATGSTAQETYLVISIFYPPEQTGIAPYAHALARAIDESGSSTSVIAGVPHFPEWRVADEYRRGISWHESIDGIDVTRVRHFVPHTPGVIGRAVLELTFFLQTAWRVRRSPARVLIAVTPSAAAVAAAVVGRRGRPVGVIVQDLVGAGASQSATSSGRIAALISRVEMRLLKKADRIGVITADFAKMLISGGVPSSRFDEVGNFTRVQPSTLSKREARTHLGWPEADYIVVHTGNMGMKQGLESVIEAARSAQGSVVHFYLVGDGNQRRRLQELGRDIGNLTFLAPVSDDDYPHVLAAADLLLLNERPGVRDMSLPSKLTSYVSASRPILAAVDADGITRRVIDRYGFALLVEAGDAPALLTAIDQLRCGAIDPDPLLKGAAAVRRSQFSPEAARARYVEFAQRLTGSDRSDRNLRCTTIVGPDDAQRIDGTFEPTG